MRARKPTLPGYIDGTMELPYPKTNIFLEENIVAVKISTICCEALLAKNYYQEVLILSQVGN